jgi:hypothetical protein
MSSDAGQFRLLLLLFASHSPRVFVEVKNVDLGYEAQIDTSGNCVHLIRNIDFPLEQQPRMLVERPRPVCDFPCADWPVGDHIMR